MKIPVAYNTELKRKITITDACKLYSEMKIKLHFLCPTTDCVQPNGQRTEIIACNYTKGKNKVGVPPHFRTKQQQNHSKNCQYYCEDIKQSSKNSTTNFHYEKKPSFHFDEICLSLNKNTIQHSTIQFQNKQSKNTNHRNSSSNTETKPRKRTAHSVADITAMYLGYRKKVDDKEITEKEWKEILINDGQKQWKLYLYFRLCEKVWHDKQFNGIHIGHINGKFESNKKTGIYLSFKNSVDDKQIYLFISYSIIKDNYNIQSFIQMFDENKNTKTNFKAYFYPSEFTKIKNKIFFIIQSDEHIYIKY